MSRKDNRIKEQIIKKILKKGDISEEKKAEIRAAIGALDINTILSNPSVLKDLKEDPSKLGNFVKENNNVNEE